MKQLKEMTTEELVNYWHGYLCLAIGEGKSREAVCLMVMALQQLGYDNAKRKK